MILSSVAMTRLEKCYIMLHICSGHFTQVSEPWPVGLLLLIVSLCKRRCIIYKLHIKPFRPHSVCKSFDGVFTSIKSTKKKFIPKINVKVWVVFRTLFKPDIFGAARAPENPHNISLSESLAPIMKFNTRVLASFIFIFANNKSCSARTINSKKNLHGWKVSLQTQFLLWNRYLYSNIAGLLSSTTFCMKLSCMLMTIMYALYISEK